MIRFTHQNRQRLGFFLALLVLSAGGMAALLRSTPYGMGLVNDSAIYLEGAANILTGNGYVRISGGGEVKQITHFPPLFSFVLAAISLTGLDLLQAARLAITLLYGLDICLVGLCVYQISRSVPFALLGSLLLAVSDVHIGVYTMVLSEPLFLTWMLAAYLCLSEAVERKSRLWLVITGIMLSLAYLTRYAGASILITMVVVLIVVRFRIKKQSTGNGIYHTWKSSFFYGLVSDLVFLLLGALPLVLGWTVYNRMVSGSSALSNRVLTWHPPAWQTLFEAFKNLLTWLAPDDWLIAQPFLGRALSLASLLLLPGFMAWVGWVTWTNARGEKKPGNSGRGDVLAFTLAWHVLVYLGFLVFSLSLFDASTPLNDRILCVNYIPEIILFASVLAWAWQASRRLSPRLPQWAGAAARWGLVIASLGLALMSARDGMTTVRQLGQEGQGFAHRGWRESPAVETVRGLPAVIIYTNKPAAIYLLTGKSAYVTPTPTDAVTGLEREGYAADLVEMQHRVRSGQAVLVLFSLRNSDDPEEVALFDALSAGLPVLADYGDDVIFGLLP